MSVVNLKISHEVAAKLCIKKAEEARINNAHLVNVFTYYYLRTIPIKTINQFKTNPNSVKSSNIVTIKSEVLPCDFLYLNRELPVSDKPIVLNREFEEKIFQLVILKDAKIKEYSEIFAECQEALIELRTFKNVKEKFPEAFEFLPTETTKSKTIDFELLRTKL